MSRIWRVRVIAVGMLWVATVATLALLDMRPSVVALAAIAGAVAAVLFLMLDLADVAAPVDWRAVSDGGATARGSDTRVRVLRRQISDGRALEGGTALHRTLVELIDDALVAHHRIDRWSEPDRARAVLGDELSRVVGSSAAAALVADPARLAAVLDRIERLASPNDAQPRPVTQERA